MRLLTKAAFAALLPGTTAIAAPAFADDTGCPPGLHRADSEGGMNNAARRADSEGGQNNAVRQADSEGGQNNNAVRRADSEETGGQNNAVRRADSEGGQNNAVRQADSEGGQNNAQSPDSEAVKLCSPPCGSRAARTATRIRRADSEGGQNRCQAIQKVARTTMQSAALTPGGQTTTPPR